MHPILFHLGPITLKSFGLMVALAMLTGISIAKKQGAKEGIDTKVIESLTFWIIVSALIGSRIYFVLAESPGYYLSHPLEILAFHRGGLYFFGGLMAAIATSIWFCRSRGLGFWRVADIMAPSIAIGASIGKIGCFLAGCCHGKVCDLPWGVTFHDPEGLARPLNTPLHPTQLYESLAWMLLFFFLVNVRRFRRFYGEVFFLFGSLFGTVRFMLDFFRGGNPRPVADLTTTQMFCIPLVIACVTLWIITRSGRLSSRVSA